MRRKEFDCGEMKMTCFWAWKCTVDIPKDLVQTLIYNWIGFIATLMVNLVDYNYNTVLLSLFFSHFSSLSVRLIRTETELLLVPCFLMQFCVLRVLDDPHIPQLSISYLNQKFLICVNRQNNRICRYSHALNKFCI